MKIDLSKVINLMDCQILMAVSVSGTIKISLERERHDGGVLEQTSKAYSEKEVTFW